MAADGFELHDAVITLASLSLSAIAFISASRATATAKKSEEVRAREAAHRVDAEAYQRAQAIYTEALAQLRRQNEAQETQARWLIRRVALLETALHAAGIPVPIDESSEPPTTEFLRRQEKRKESPS